MRYRLLALLLAFVVIFSGGAIAEASSADGGEGAAVESEEYNALKAIDMLTDDLINIKSGDLITRAQYVGALYRLGNFPKSGSIKIPFNDVSADTAHSDAIAYFYEMGLISGGGDAMFEPDRPITYAEAIKISIDMLGYKEYALRVYGGYPAGPVKAANRIELIKGMNLSDYSAPLTADDGIKLLFNSGITCMLEGEKYDSDGLISYTNNKDRYILSVNSNIFFGEGKMTCNGVVSLADDNNPDNSIKIDDTVYNVNDVDYTEFLGLKVKFFYKSEGGIKTILWAFGDSINETLSLKYDELSKDDSDYSLTNIVYWKNDRKYSARISRYADVIYNNTVCNDSKLEMIKPESGYIWLVDNNGDGEYDVVTVSEYKNMFVDAIAADREFILGKYGDSLVFDDYDNVKIFKDGKRISVSDMTNNCIASYLESLDKKNLFIYVNGEGISETLQKVSNNDSDIYYTFEGGEYKLSAGFKKIAEEKNYYVPEVNPGETYKYFLDIDGEIAAIEEVSDGKMQYVYIIDGKKNDNSFADEKSVKLRLILKNGTDTTAVTADKIIIDGEGDKNGVNLLDKIGTDESGKVKKQVAKMRFDQNGEIKEVEFASNVSATSEYGYDETKFTLDYQGTAYYMSGNSSMFAYKYCVNGNTICFAKLTDADGNVDYCVVPYARLSGNKNYNLKVYDCNRFFEAAAIEIDVNAYDNDVDGHVLVDSVETFLHTDGEIYKKIVGVSFGKTVGYRVDNDVELPEGLRRGDIVRISVFNNKVSKVSLICRLSDNPAPFIKGEVGNEFCQVFGPLYSNNGRIMVTVNPEGSKYGKLLPTSAWGTSTMLVSVYDSKRDRISLSSVNAIQQKVGRNGDGSISLTDDSVKVFIYRRYNYVKELIVAYY